MLTLMQAADIQPQVQAMSGHPKPVFLGTQCSLCQTDVSGAAVKYSCMHADVMLCEKCNIEVQNGTRYEDSRKWVLVGWKIQEASGLFGSHFGKCEFLNLLVELLYLR